MSVVEGARGLELGVAEAIEDRGGALDQEPGPRVGVLGGETALLQIHEQMIVVHPLAQVAGEQLEAR